MKRICPNCHSKCEIGTDIVFDEKNNIVCKHCHKFLYGSTKQDESDISKIEPPTTTTSYAGSGYNPHAVSNVNTAMSPYTPMNNQSRNGVHPVPPIPNDRWGEAYDAY